MIAALLLLTVSSCAKIPCSYTASKYPLCVAGIVSDIAKRMEEKGTLAATFAMVEQGEVFCTGAFGWRDKEAGIAATNETLFNFGSCAKVITTTAMMKLVDEGLVDLDGKVVTYLPEFQMADARAADITVRMLLNHSSGFPGTTRRGSATLTPAHDEHMAIVLDDLAQDRLKADPGAFSVYCNDGFSMAEMLIARVSGKRFSQFVKDEIFTPLGMAHSQTADEPYAEGSRVANRKALVASEFEIMNVYGSGGFSMTAADWCRLLDMLAGGGVSSSGVRILSEESAAAMAQAQTVSNFWLNSDAGFGLGWDSVAQPCFEQLGITALSKSGGTVSYTSHVIVIPQYDLGVAISCVGADLGVADVAVLALGEILTRKGVIKGLPSAPALAAEAALPAEQRAFEGYYGLSSVPFMARFAEDDHLDLLVRQNGQWEPSYADLTYRANGRYAKEGSTDEFYFQEVAGHGTYLMHAAPGTAGKAPISLSCFAERIGAFDAPAEAIAAWQGRSGTWLRANTVPMSLELTSPSKTIESFDELPGLVFVGGCALQVYSDAEARMFLQLPYNPGRDMNDAQIRDINGAEWLRFGDLIFCPASGVATLPAAASESIAIGEEGFGEWRIAGGQTAQSFTVTATGTETRWAAYDANFTLTGDSLCGDPSALTVPAEGYVQFLGAPGAAFNVTAAK